VLVSGDEDFVYAVNAVAYKGCRVEVAGFRSNTAPKLIDVADYFIDLGEIAEKVRKEPTHRYGDHHAPPHHDDAPNNHAQQQANGGHAQQQQQQRNGQRQEPAPAPLPSAESDLADELESDHEHEIEPLPDTHSDFIRVTDEQ